MKQIIAVVIVVVVAVAAAASPPPTSSASAEAPVLVRHNPATGTASILRLGPGVVKAQGASPEDRARDVLGRYGAAFGISDAEKQLEAVTVRSDRLGHTHMSFRQVHNGVPVFGSMLRVHLDANGRPTAINGAFVPSVTSVDLRPDLSPPEAETVAVAAVAKTAGTTRPVTVVGSTLYVFRAGLVRGVPGADHLVWEVEVADGALVDELVYVDAHDGRVVDRMKVIEELNRRVHEFEFGNVVWQEGDPVPYTDPGNATATTEVNDLIQFAEQTFALYSNLSGGAFLSWDGAEAIMHSVRDVNTADWCPNASWNGRYTSYCEGMVADDVTGHEWTHAYTDGTHDLIYQWQPGALNESYSDIFGELVDLLNGTGTDTPDSPRLDGECSTWGGGSASDPSVRWLQGEDTVLVLVRDMWNPLCAGDPGKVSDPNYACSEDDSGGVHSNSGVSNHAFALLVDGGQYNGHTIEAIGMTRAAHVYWRAMAAYQVPTTGFTEHADLLGLSCEDLLGAQLTDLRTGGVSQEVITTSDCAQVAAVMAAVEMRAEPTQCAFQTMLEPVPPFAPGGLVVFSETFDSDPGAAWSVSNLRVFPEFVSRQWVWTTDLPAGGSSGAFFAVNPTYGDCQGGSNDQSGVLHLDTPTISLPAGSGTPVLVFDHYMATEPRFDGGNLEIRVNGGALRPIPGSAFTLSPYNTALAGDADGNTNPMAGEEAFSGGDEGQVFGSWGQSRVDLSAFASAGDTIGIRFDFGVDGCTGLDGWYVDNVRVVMVNPPRRPGRRASR